MTQDDEAQTYQCSICESDWGVDVRAAVRCCSKQRPTMTQDEREELARAILGRTAPRAADAIAPIIERMVAARVARNDNAVKRAIVASGEVGITEGERRATAAIVAYLGNEAADYPGTDYGQWVARIADAIERGDHLTEAKPPQN